MEAVGRKRRVQAIEGAAEQDELHVEDAGRPCCP